MGSKKFGGPRGSPKGGGHEQKESQNRGIDYQNHDSGADILRLHKRIGVESNPLVTGLRVAPLEIGIPGFSRVFAMGATPSRSFFIFSPRAFCSLHPA